MKKDRSQKIEFPIYKEKDVLELEGEFKTLLREHIFEQQQDDDVDTDEEVLYAGINQCYTDLKDLKNVIRNHRHFRC